MDILAIILLVMGIIVLLPLIPLSFGLMIEMMGDTINGIRDKFRRNK